MFSNYSSTVVSGTGTALATLMLNNASPIFKTFLAFSCWE
jgi:hypothetical protein